MDHGSEMVMVAGFPEPVFWLSLSGVVFLTMAIILLVGPFRRERNTLMNAFLGFLGGMAAFHIFGAIAMYKGIPLLMYVASFAAITGSAFVFKFPLSAIINPVKRQMLFLLALLVGWGVLVYLLYTSADMGTVMNAAAIYMVIVSGLISGFYMLAQGLRINDPAAKIKCIGGGCSIIFCCLITHLIVILIGFTALAKLFMILTPITVVLSVVVARRFVRGTMGV